MDILALLIGMLLGAAFPIHRRYRGKHSSTWTVEIAQRYYEDREFWSSLGEKNGINHQYPGPSKTKRDASGYGPSPWNVSRMREA